MDRYFSKMMNDINRYSPEDTISKRNLTRICYVITLVLLLEIVNLFDEGVQSTPYLLITTSTIILIGLFVLPLSLCILKRFDKIPARARRRLYFCFWAFLPTLVAFSFLIRDAEANRPPLNLLIIIGLISMVPVLTPRETVLVFILPTITNLIVYAVVNSNMTYMMYSLIFCLAGVLITVLVHRQYIFLIRELNYQMLHDSLTHLLSRQAGTEKAEMLLSACAREKHCFVAIMIDIDHFKNYNDSKGHLYGDDVLKKVAGAIHDTFLRGNDVVYRYGGEEFCACISASPENVQVVIDRLTDKIRALAIPAEKATVSEWLTISLGVAICSEANRPLEEILKDADDQLYISKNAGRDRVSVVAC